MSPISRQITEAAINFECDTGYLPDHLYLGTRALDELRMEVEPMMLHKAYSETLPPGVVAQFRGLNIYVVMDDPHHLNVA